MLPDNLHLPAKCNELRLHSCIAGAVRLELVLPEVGVSAGSWRVACRTEVPEAAVDKDGQPECRKDNIWPSREGGFHAVAAGSRRPQGLPEGNFSARDCSVRPHRSAGVLRGRHQLGHDATLAFESSPVACRVNALHAPHGSGPSRCDDRRAPELRPLEVRRQMRVRPHHQLVSPAVIDSPSGELSRSPSSPVRRSSSSRRSTARDVRSTRR